MFDSRKILKSITVTILFSMLGGLLAEFWAYILDPTGTGASIRIAPVLVFLMLLSICLFFTGLITIRERYGPFLLLSGITIPFAFLFLVDMLQTILG